MLKCMELLNRIVNNERALRKWKVALYLFVILICIIPIILSLFFAPIAPDSAYYLSIVERISEGLVPYTEIKIGYTPLVFYITLAFKTLFSIEINYEFYLLVNYLFQFACTFLIFKITNLFTKNNLYSFLSSAFFIIAAHWNDGNYFLLEMPALFFGLLAIYICLIKNAKSELFLLVGLFSAFSFLSKQYGLGFFALSVFLVLFDNDKLKKTLFVILGFSLPVFVCFLVWGNDFLNAIFTEYGKNRTVSESLLSLIDRIIYLFIRIPVLIAAIYFIPVTYIKSDTQHKKAIAFLTVAISGFFLQFYFAKYAHYYLLILPFVSILTFLILNNNKTKITYFIVSLSFLMSVYATYHDQVYKVYFLKNELKASQYKLAEEILKNTDQSKTLYISEVGLISQYYLTNMQPPNMATIGYSFGMALNNETHIHQINSAGYILKYKQNTNNYGLNTKEEESTLKKRNKTEFENVYLYK